MSVQTVRRWLRDCLPLRFTSRNPFFDNHELLLERDESLCEKYDVHMRSIRRWKHNYQHSRFTCSVDVDNADNKELANKYGVRAATINVWKKEADAQWSIWHEYCENCSDGFESMCEPICICCECGIILFPCDIKWVNNRKKTSPYRASKFENLSYSLSIETMDKDGVLKVACCRHCGNLNSSEELFDDFESLPDCIKDVAGFGESRRLAIGSLYCSTFKPSNYSYVHSSGPLGYGMSIDHLRGMAWQGYFNFKSTLET